MLQGAKKCAITSEWSRQHSPAIGAMLNHWLPKEIERPRESASPGFKWGSFSASHQLVVKLNGLALRFSLKLKTTCATFGCWATSSRFVLSSDQAPDSRCGPSIGRNIQLRLFVDPDQLQNDEVLCPT